MVTYPVVIYKDEGSDFGATVPDLPGCVSAGETLSEVLAETREAIQCHLEGLAKDGDLFPAPSEVEDLAMERNDGFVVYAAIDVDLDRLSAESERINITLPKWLISAIDASESNRSRFLAECAIEGLQQAGKRKAG